MKTHKSIIEWIPVEDGLPPEHVSGSGAKYYLVKIEGWYPNFGQGILINGEWHLNFSSKYTATVTHWADIE
jgi:hypothetical protein